MGGRIIPKNIESLLTEYLAEIQKMYGSHLKSVILYGSYAKRDFTPESDVDIMILVALKDEEMEHFRHGESAYPFDRNVQKESVTAYEAGQYP